MLLNLHRHTPHISIHAPSRERRVGHIDKHHCRNFNPRSLAGATQISERYTSSHQFQSTLPRGSDWKCSIKIIGITISIHAPSRERRHGQEYSMASRHQFQSTLPRGSDFNKIKEFILWLISIHAPSRERRECSLCC